MELLRSFKPRWFVYSAVFVVLIAVVACGTAAPEPAAPQESVVPVQPAPAVEPAPAATSAPVSAEVGQGAIGAGAIVPTAVPAVVPAAEAAVMAEPAITRLKIARGPTTWDLIDPVAGRGDLPILLPLFEGLVQFDQYTDSVPMLSPEWSTNDDFSVWTFRLHEGIEFHKGWGEMTAKDVEHTLFQERRLDHNDSRAGTWRDLLNRVEMPDGPDGHIVALHLNKPEPIMTTYVSTNYTAVIRSKNHWDDGGGMIGADFQPNEAGLQLTANEPIGTGPYQFAEQAESEYVIYDSPGFTHWRKTPDFPELQIFFVREPSTQLAMLVTGEVHAAEIPRDLQVGAKAVGMQVITGTTPAIRLVGFMGGNFIPSRPEFDDTQPMTNPLVRQAMNLAIDRKEINEVFFDGRAELMMQTHSHEKFPGWQPEWLDRFEAEYGYDPERAKQLLAQAGYPEGFSIVHQSYPRPGLPEMQDIGELVNSYWQQIGIDTQFKPVERSINTKLLRSQGTQNTAWLHTGSFTEPTRAIFVYHYSPTGAARYEDPYFDTGYEALEVAGTAEERDQLIREMGEFCFDIHCSIPLFWVPFEFMINPEVIAEWKTPGVFGVRDFEYVVAVR
jgi:peptide/nickel transport system substrate-binding protein